MSSIWCFITIPLLVPGELDRACIGPWGFLSALHHITSSDDAQWRLYQDQGTRSQLSVTRSSTSKERCETRASCSQLDRRDCRREPSGDKLHP